MSDFVNISSTENDKRLYVQSDGDYFVTSYYFEDVFNEGVYKKFIKNTERQIRNSNEYRNYIKLLKETQPDLTNDSILGNINSNDAKLEFHHYPFSLYDIIDIICNQRFLLNKKVSSLSVAKEVMECHYEHIIGLVPLMTTTHELTHAGALYLSKKQIFGDYRSFMDRYKNGISMELKEKVRDIEEKSDKINSDCNGLLS